jgi:hypothetical protein
MKSRQFTLGLMALILIQLISFKTVAQCCVASVNLTEKHEYACSTFPFPQCFQYEYLQWQRVQKTGCTTPVKYKLQYRSVGDSLWTTVIVTVKKPDAKFGYADVGPGRCYCYPLPCHCIVTYEWRVQGICSDTSKTAWVAGSNFTLISQGERFPIVTTSSASATSSQSKFTVAAYPNPVASELNLSGNLKAGGPVNVQIINSVGQTILLQDYNFNSFSFSTSVDVSKLPPGVYLVVVSDKTERATLSIVKQ